MAFQPRVEKVEHYACAEKECKFHSINWANGCSRYPNMGLCRGIIEEGKQQQARTNRQLYESQRSHVQERYEAKGALGELDLRLKELASMMRNVAFLLETQADLIPNEKGRGTNEDDAKAGASQ